MKDLVVVLLLSPLDLKNLVEASKKSRVSTKFEEVFGPATVRVSSSASDVRKRVNHLADSFLSIILSFFISSTSICVLDVPERILKNFVGEMVFSPTYALSFEPLPPAPSRSSAVTFARDRVRATSRDVPRLWLLALRGVGRRVVESFRLDMRLDRSPAVCGGSGKSTSSEVALGEGIVSELRARRRVLGVDGG